MKRTTIFLDELLERDLHAIACRQKRSMASVVREALGGYVDRELRGKGRGLRFAGIGSSGRTRTVDRQEDLLFRELTPHGDARREARGRRSGKR